MIPSVSIRDCAIAFGCALVLGACAGEPVRFSGDRSTPVVDAEKVAIATVAPAGFVHLGELSSDCTLTQGRREIDDESLSDVDCSASRLRWALRERAAEVGAVLVVDRGCYSDGPGGPDARVRITCTGTAWRAEHALPASGPAPDPDVARRIDFGYSLDAWRVRLKFLPDRGARPEHALRGDLVEDVARMPPGRVVLGTISARCEECSLDTLRAGVRVAAGRLGASDVVGVRCVSLASGAGCRGVAAGFAVAPELDPRMP